MAPQATSHMGARWRAPLTAVLAAMLAACAPGGPPAGPAPVELPELARQVEIVRTEHGVPHVLGENLRAASFGLAYVQLEDYGPGIIAGLEAARGTSALIAGRERVAADADSRLRHARAVETFPLLSQDTRDVYDGFAHGVNHFIRMHAAELPAWVRPDFTGTDVLAREIIWPSAGEMNSFRRRLERDPGDPALLVLGESGAWQRADASGGEGDENGNSGLTAGGGVGPSRGSFGLDGGNGSNGGLTAGGGVGEGMGWGGGRGRESSVYGGNGFALADDWAGQDPDNVGSNAWALAPSRTASGRAILLRNPHLSWTAGYYEAHVRVPGKLDFYGDFRIGGPFTVIGGFNPYLGFATTNNASRSHEFYAFRADPSRPDAILVDGVSRPLRREVVTVEYRDSIEAGTATEERWTSEFGPVVHRADSLVYVFRPAASGEYRAGEQWLAMMTAQNLDEWKDAMRMQARTSSNFTYADRDGNIFYVWVTTPPSLPHPPGGDTLAIYATRSDQVWSRIVPFDSLPQLHNPPGGYLHQENDSPHYTNLNRILDHASFRFEVEEPRLRMRSQHALRILHNDRVFSLEDVVEAKHSMGMLLADRVKDDLIAAVRRTNPTGDVARALELLTAWDNTAAADSRGAVLFETWWNRYRTQRRGQDLHAVEWTEADPASTPRGLADANAAAEAFAWAVPETASRFERWDVAWGDVHRVRRGDVDAPVGGCGGALGCFRVLNFDEQPDGKRAANGGDGWVLAVEFGDTPRAYSILAYGQSPDSTSRYHADQAALFAANRMKTVRWTDADIARHAVERYRPGQEARR
jgi:acyl-homoserine-lactone acylase